MLKFLSAAVICEVWGKCVTQILLNKEGLFMALRIDGYTKKQIAKPLEPQS